VQAIGSIDCILVKIGKSVGRVPHEPKIVALMCVVLCLSFYVSLHASEFSKLGTKTRHVGKQLEALGFILMIRYLPSDLLSFSTLASNRNWFSFLGAGDPNASSIASNSYWGVPGPYSMDGHDLPPST